MVGFRKSTALAKQDKSHSSENPKKYATFHDLSLSLLLNQGKIEGNPFYFWSFAKVRAGPLRMGQHQINEGRGRDAREGLVAPSLKWRGFSFMEQPCSTQKKKPFHSEGATRPVHIPTKRGNRANLWKAMFPCKGPLALRPTLTDGLPFSPCSQFLSA